MDLPRDILSAFRQLTGLVPVSSKRGDLAAALASLSPSDLGVVCDQPVVVEKPLAVPAGVHVRLLRHPLTLCAPTTWGRGAGLLGAGPALSRVVATDGLGSEPAITLLDSYHGEVSGLRLESRGRSIRIAARDVGSYFCTVRDVLLAGPGAEAPGSVAVDVDGSVAGRGVYGNTVERVVLDGFERGVWAHGSEGNGNTIAGVVAQQCSAVFDIEGSENLILGGFCYANAGREGAPRTVARISGWGNKVLGLQAEPGAWCRIAHLTASSFENVLDVTDNCSLGPLDESGGRNTIRNQKTR